MAKSAGNMIPGQQLAQFPEIITEKKEHTIQSLAVIFCFDRQVQHHTEEQLSVIDHKSKGGNLQRHAIYCRTKCIGKTK